MNRNFYFLSEMSKPKMCVQALGVITPTHTTPLELHKMLGVSVKYNQKEVLGVDISGFHE